MYVCPHVSYQEKFDLYYMYVYNILLNVKVKIYQVKWFWTAALVISNLSSKHFKIKVNKSTSYRSETPGKF